MKSFLAEFVFEVGEGQGFVIADVFEEEDFEVIEVFFLVCSDNRGPRFFGSHGRFWFRFFSQMSPTKTRKKQKADPKERHNAMNVGWGRKNYRDGDGREKYHTREASWVVHHHDHASPSSRRHHHSIPQIQYQTPQPGHSPQ